MAVLGSYRNWRLETDAARIAWLYADKADSSTNVLSKEVLEELHFIIDRITAERPQGLIILSAKGNGFIAGADIKEFTAIQNYDEALQLITRGQSILDRIEKLPFPTVAMIHGFCLGGGLELALACRYRVAEDDPRTRLGLPEVRLGIHPGFGGTVRLPPLVGAPHAMDLMLSGRTVEARRAKRMGLVDYAVPKRQLRRAAMAMVEEHPLPHQPGFLARMSNAALVRPVLAGFLRKKTAEKVVQAHYPAPFALIDLWSKHGGARERMMREEGQSVARLLTGETAQNLIRVFALQERLKSLGRSGEFTPQRVHVIGAGVMGGDIAAWCALRGLQVTVQDRNQESLGRVMKRAYGLFKKKLRQPRLVQAALDRLVPDMHGAGLKRADVVIEAIFEDIDAKQGLYREIEPVIRPDALLATNTSSIPLETLSQVLSRPERLVGVHFFNPVAQMQLVEVVSAANTAPEAAQQAAAFVRRIDRLPLPVKGTPGFLVNRVLMPYLLEAVALESEGVSAAVIDQAATQFGMPMGPILLADTVGLDICLSVAEILAEQLHGTVPERLRELVAAGRLGRKSGQGFYSYKGGNPDKAKLGREDRIASEITDRLMYRYFNEAVACLREGVVADAELLDAGMIFGTGFAPFRGGPMHYIEKTGLPRGLQRLEELEHVYGERFHPDPAWVAK
ncbi:MAG: 3-hydroxyacyl-CoA dehydrogenase NAD-binding domain-containing protein [Gammaproteobacteria bacterium]|jgi:3-hydroxyacyl-CoA dehydrogenase/enoyl-CoA hydratase/3-hydroxybutyryl-CoA epimerase